MSRSRYPQFSPVWVLTIQPKCRYNNPELNTGKHVMHAETSLFELFEAVPRIVNINLGHIQLLASNKGLIGNSQVSVAIRMTYCPFYSFSR